MGGRDTVAEAFARVDRLLDHRPGFPVGEWLEHLARDAGRNWELSKLAARLKPFRAGDHVHHVGSGEDWVLACDQDGDDVLPAGWPETIAQAAHCRLLKAATDEEREKMLREVARPDRTHDRRRSIAGAQLAAIDASANQDVRP